MWVLKRSVFGSRFQRKKTKLDTTSECREISKKLKKEKIPNQTDSFFSFLLISRHSVVVSNFVFLRWNREPNTLLLSTHMTHDFEKNISPLLVAWSWKSDIWDTIAKNPDLIEQKGHSFGHMGPNTCQNQLRYLRQHLVCSPLHA